MGCGNVKDSDNSMSLSKDDSAVPWRGIAAPDLKPGKDDGPAKSE